MDGATRIGWAMLIGLVLSALATVVLVLALGVPLGLGLLALAGLDVLILVWGYVAIRRSFRMPG